MNYAAKLNEYGQKTRVQVQYEDVNATGPDHIKTFTVRAVVNGKRFPVGTGNSKREAKENAAIAALKALGMLHHTESKNFPFTMNCQTSGQNTSSTAIPQPNYLCWLNEHSQKTNVTYKPVESTRVGAVSAPYCCRYKSSSGKSYPEANGKTKKEAKEKAAMLVYQEQQVLASKACDSVMKTQSKNCKRGPGASQVQKQTSSTQSNHPNASPGLSCQPFGGASIVSSAGGWHSGFLNTIPAIPATFLPGFGHLAGSTSACRPVPAGSQTVYTQLNFFNKHKAELETRLSIRSVLIKLEGCGILDALEREAVEAERTSTNQNRALILLLSRKGEVAQEKFYEILKDTDPYLVKDLEK